MKPWQRFVSSVAFVGILALIVLLWFFTTGEALRHSTREALSKDSGAWESVTDDFSAVSGRLHDAMDSLAQQRAYIASQSQSTSSIEIDPAIIEQIKQQLEAQTSSSTYAEENN